MLATPDVASVAVTVTVLVVSPAWVAVTVGDAVSTLTVRDLIASALPATSVERYSIRREPSPITGIAMVYGVQAPPSIRYSVEPRPDPSVPSAAARVNDGLVVYHPWSPVAAGMVSVDVGAAVSILTVKDLIASTLPALSVERYSTRRAPSPVTETAAVYGVQAPPAIRYSVEAMPDPPVSSAAARVNDGRVVYQPAWLLAAGMVSVVVGAAVSVVGSTPGSQNSSLPSVKKLNVAVMPAPAAVLAAEMRPIFGLVMLAML